MLTKYPGLMVALIALVTSIVIGCNSETPDPKKEEVKQDTSKLVPSDQIESALSTTLNNIQQSRGSYPIETFWSVRLLDAPTAGGKASAKQVKEIEDIERKVLQDVQDILVDPIIKGTVSCRDSVPLVLLLLEKVTPSGVKASAVGALQETYKNYPRDCIILKAVAAKYPGAKVMPAIVTGRNFNKSSSPRDLDRGLHIIITPAPSVEQLENGFGPTVRLPSPAEMPAAIMTDYRLSLDQKELSMYYHLPLVLTEKGAFCKNVMALLGDLKLPETRYGRPLECVTDSMIKVRLVFEKEDNGKWKFLKSTEVTSAASTPDKSQ